MNVKRKAPSLSDALKFAWSGIVTTCKNERNFRIELCFAAFALLASVFLALEPGEWAIIIILIVLVLALELTNSALESLADLVSPDVHPLAKQAKDAMAGAVLLAAMGAIIVGLIIYAHAALRLWGM